MRASIAAAIDASRIELDLFSLAKYREAELPGWTRRVFGEADRAGRSYVARLMRDAGLDTTIDAVGNVVGRLAGSGGLRGALVAGSHTDTVPGGGRFDGVIGVLGAIEVVRALREQSISLHHDLLVVDFLGEEPNPQGLSCVGSRALAGTLTRDHLALAGEVGETLAQAIVRGGGDPDGALNLAWSRSDLHRYFELHIEQGPYLERLQRPIGVVRGIVGIQRVRTLLSGRADHAGTMPMLDRHDAGLAAAELALAVESLADGDNVATTGVIEVLPGATNVVPASALLLSECRSSSSEWLAGFRARYEVELGTVARRRGVRPEVSWLTLEPPTPMDAKATGVVAEASSRLGVEAVELVSFAGHDAVQMAHLGPCGMIFVPSKGGRSHTPEEWTDLDQVAVGAKVLAETLLLADTT